MFMLSFINCSGFTEHLSNKLSAQMSADWNITLQYFVEFTTKSSSSHWINERQI